MLDLPKTDFMTLTLLPERLEVIVGPATEPLRIAGLSFLLVEDFRFSVSEWRRVVLDGLLPLIMCGFFVFFCVFV